MVSNKLISIVMELV